MAQTLLIKKNGIDRLVNPVFFDYGDVVFEPSRLRVVGPGVDAAEFVDAGIAQLSQRRGCSLAAVSTAAVDQDRGVLLRNHLGGSRHLLASVRFLHPQGKKRIDQSHLL